LPESPFFFGFSHATSRLYVLAEGALFFRMECGAFIQSLFPGDSGSGLMFLILISGDDTEALPDAHALETVDG